MWGAIIEQLAARPKPDAFAPKPSKEERKEERKELGRSRRGKGDSMEEENLRERRYE